MAIEYIKHNRNVTNHDIDKYGKLATHDLLIPCLLMYELGKIPDKNGTIVDMNTDKITQLMEKTNKWIKSRHLLPAAKLFTQWNKPVEEINAIPVIKNHNTGAVENKVGYSHGLLYTDNIDDKLGLFVNLCIIDNDAKQDVENGLLNSVSIGTRPAPANEVGSI